MSKAWMRVLTVTLTSTLTKRSYTFGANEGTNLDITVTGYKYMSTLKDSCVIEIKNLSYFQVIDIIDSKFYDVEVKCGYKDSGRITMFKGAVLYISNNIEPNRTHTIVILCGSNLIAKYKQSRLNLSLNSSINTYTAIKQIAAFAGLDLSKINVSNSMNKPLSNDRTTVNTTFAQFIENLCESNENYVVSTDSTLGDDIKIFDISKTNSRVINMKNEWILLTSGYPRLTSEGLTLTVLPTLNFICGDIIDIDNALINIYASSSNEGDKNYSYYLDKEGQYLLYEVKYQLENRGDNFSVELYCKSLSLVKGLYGGTQ